MGVIVRQCEQEFPHRRHTIGTERAYDPSGSYVEDIECPGIPDKRTTEQRLAMAEARVRKEWPGTHIAERGAFVAPIIREGGATDALLKMTMKIVAEELKNQG